MNSKAAPSGSNPNATQDTILQEELLKLKQHRSRMKEENSKYIENHPELTTLLDGFVTAVISHKPSDLFKFGQHYFSSMRNSGPIGPSPIVISVASGLETSGIIALLMKNYPDIFESPVSHTTRGARKEEVDGKSFHFVDKAEFEYMVRSDAFIQYQEVHTYMYGISKDAIETVRKNMKLCVLELDRKGIDGVKKNSNIDCKFLHIAEPTASGTATGGYDCVVTFKDDNTLFNEIVSILSVWYADINFD